ncbi:MAG: cytochrome oxidase subunit [Mycobacterium sp.]|jgi:nitric oxide reductase NorE protein|nr:cytochrome oxidase subunit [Mycobacterium sp.]
MTTPTRALAGREDERGERIPGEPGVWVFIVCEMVVFAVLFVVIVWNRGQNPGLFATSQRLLSQPLGLTNTVVLIGGSVLVVLVLAAASQAQYRRASQFLVAAVACGAAFVSVKAIEYGLVIHHGMSFHSNVFWMLFFAVTGAHLLHVVIGATVLVVIRQRVASGLPGPRDEAWLVSATCYWHMVDLLWLVLFPLFYLVN